MPKFARLAVAAFAASALGCGGGGGGGGSSTATHVVIQDSDFTEGNWSSAAYGDSSQSGIVMQRQDTGGNPGAYMQGTVTLYGSAVYGLAWATGNTYTPSVQGAIASLDFSRDLVISGTQSGFTSGLLIVQNGHYYVAARASVTNVAWGSAQTTQIRAADFDEFNPQTQQFVFGSTPDFSSTGAPIVFGIEEERSGGGTTVASLGLDNYVVTVNQS